MWEKDKLIMIKEEKIRIDTNSSFSSHECYESEDVSDDRGDLTV